MKACGRKDRRGAWIQDILRAVRLLGKNTRAVSPISLIATYPSPHNSTCQNVTSRHPKRFPKSFDQSKTYLLRSKSHILAVKGGEVHDWSVNNSLRILEIHEVI